MLRRSIMMTAGRLHPKVALTQPTRTRHSIGRTPRREAASQDIDSGCLPALALDRVLAHRGCRDTGQDDTHSHGSGARATPPVPQTDPPPASLIVRVKYIDLAPEKRTP